MQKDRIFLLIIFTICTFVITISFVNSSYFRTYLSKKINNQVKGISISFNAKPVEINGKQKVKYPVDYTIVLLGDSMMERLGNSDRLRADLLNFYPGKTFEVLNYGFGSTNILSAQKRLDSETFYGRVFRPITDIDFDLILIESFGHNPLSELTLPEGLQKQTQALDKIIQTLKEKNPNAKIVFVGTLAPSKKHYAQKTADLTPQEREKWASERIAYIENHLGYAKSHNIPYIDVFTKSLAPDRDLNLDFVNFDDFIHPSEAGLNLIEDEIANFIYTNHIFK